MAGEPTTGSVFRPRKARPAWRRWSLRNPVIQTAMFTTLIVCVVLLMTRTLSVTERPISAEDVGEPALDDIKATHDFVYVETDHEATRNKREEASAAVPKIYDYDPSQTDHEIDRVVEAMSTMRAAMRRAVDRKREALDKAAPAGEPIVTEPDAGALPSPGPKHPVPALVERVIVLSDDERAQVAKEGRPAFDQSLQVILPDAIYAVLAKHEFDQRTEKAVVGLLRDVLAGPIVPDRRLLTVEGRRGIIVRRLGDDGTMQSEHRYEFSGFIDLPAVAVEIDRYAAVHLDRSFDPELRDAVLTMVKSLVEPNTVYNEDETAEARLQARDSVAELVVQRRFRQGQNIVDRGHIVTPTHLRIVDEMAGTKGDTRLAKAQLMVGALIVTLLFLLLFFLFGRANIKKFRTQVRDLVLMGSALLMTLALQQGLMMAVDNLASAWPSEQKFLLYYGIPVAVGAMVVRLVLNSESALVFSVAIAIFGGLAADGSLDYAAFVLASSTVGAGSVGKVSHRMDLLKASIKVGGINTLLVLAILLLQGELKPTLYVWAMAMSFVGGLTSGILVSALMPLVEWIFAYTTDIKLLELADLNHPALAELSMKAPGSYHHSVIVGNLSRAAAEAIGANPLLARVGSYYHDLGKGKNPQYFAENQRPGHNPHDKLKPNMSALIIKAHVKDGLEIARSHGLPEELGDYIAQHHGTSLIAYFYHRAKSMEDPDIPEVNEKDYRYPGPKPQTRETAICMLADGIEAASRAMPEPTADRLKGLVQKMINKTFADGQLDECDLTLKDLNAIAKAFIRVLVGMYHFRPQYPGDKKPSAPKSGNHDRPKGKRTRTSSGTSKGAIAAARRSATPDNNKPPDAVTAKSTRPGSPQVPAADEGKSGQSPDTTDTLDDAQAVVSSVLTSADTDRSPKPTPESPSPAETGGAQPTHDADSSDSQDRDEDAALERDDADDKGKPPLRRLGLS